MVTPKFAKCEHCCPSSNCNQENHPLLVSSDFENLQEKSDLAVLTNYGGRLRKPSGTVMPVETDIQPLPLH